MARRVERDAALLSERASKGVTDQPSGHPGGRPHVNGSSSSTPAVRCLNFHPSLDDLPEEQTLVIEVNGRPVSTIICSPIAVRELAVGWVFSRGVIEDLGGIGRISEFPGRVSIMVDDATKLPTGDSSVDSGYLANAPVANPTSSHPAPLTDLSVDPAERAGLTMPRGRFLNVVQSLFVRLHRDRAAHVNHFAAAVDGAGVCIVARDLSRQNAANKVIGWTVMQGQDRSRLMFCMTGQVNAAMVASAWRAGFPLIASTGSPTADAVDIADVAGITIVGRVLEPERAVYSHGWRLPVGDDEPAAGEANLEV